MLRVSPSGTHSLISHNFKHTRMVPDGISSESTPARILIIASPAGVDRLSFGRREWTGVAGVGSVRSIGGGGAASLVAGVAAAALIALPLPLLY